MLRAQGDGLHNPVVDPLILIWNLEPWLKYKRLNHYRYIFHNITFNDFFLLNNQFFVTKDVSDDMTERFYHCILEVLRQRLYLLKIRQDLLTVFRPYDILKRLQDFMPSSSIPLLGLVPRIFMESLEMVYCVIPHVQKTFERNKCWGVVYAITIHAVNNQSFFGYEVDKLKEWKKKSSTYILPHSR